MFGEFIEGVVSQKCVCQAWPGCNTCTKPAWFDFCFAPKRKKHHKNKTMVCDFEMFHVVKQTILFVIMFLEASNFICLKEVFAMIDLKGDMFC